MLMDRMLLGGDDFGLRIGGAEPGGQRFGQPAPRPRVTYMLMPNCGSRGSAPWCGITSNWDGTVPTTLWCRGWFDGVRGMVRVRLSTDDEGMVEFDAELRSGVIATAQLVEELRSAGYTKVDCGEVPAYPTEVGSTITCAVTGEEGQGFVVATVTDRHGGVTITDF